MRPRGGSKVALLGLVALGLCSQAGCAGPEIKLQVMEIEFSGAEADLVHHCTLAVDRGWSGQVVFEYPFGRARIFRSPEEILDWEEKVDIQTIGSTSVNSFDISEDSTTVTVSLVNSSKAPDVIVRLTLIDSVEEVDTYSVPFITSGGEKWRFSLVTPEANLPIGSTKVIVHLPSEQVLTNYLPQERVTVLDRGATQESVLWSFPEGSPQVARVFVEYGTKGRLGRLMLLVLVIIVLGVILAAVKFLLILDEESITY